MTVKRQTKFSPMSLNLLMLACIVLIIIFSSSQSSDPQHELPHAPKLDARIWQTDSGAKVWYSPHLSKTIELNFWYLAGFAYDDQTPGMAMLNSQLLMAQAKQMQLPMTIDWDADFIKIQLHLSTEPLAMKSQIDDFVKLLYQPTLSSSVLNTLRTINLETGSDALRKALFAQHPYGNAKYGDLKSLGSISRAQIQNYHRRFLHPSRAFASIVGDLSEHAAQIIMESLLPSSRYKPASKQTFTSQPIRFKDQQKNSAWIWPGLIIKGNDPLAIQAYEATQVGIELIHQLFVTLAPTQTRMDKGQYNQFLSVQDWPNLQQAMQDKLDWDMIRAAKYKLASQWMTHFHSPEQISAYLVYLNAYGLPINHMDKSIKHLDNLDYSDWQLISNSLLYPKAQPQP